MRLSVRLITAIVAVLLFSGCASTPNGASPQDPWEGFNRTVHGFNDTMDSYLLKPVAQGYQAVTPDPVENSVSNFFGNLLEVRNIFNDVLQWKWKQAGVDTSRFLINSTLGLAGFFDVAKMFNLEKSEGEDFGQTLAAWGVGSGPYLVIPFLGPSTLRDAGGLPVDWAMKPVGYLDDVPLRNSLQGFNFVVDRANLLNAEEFVSGDKYVFFREAYLQRRDYLINDGQVEDDFGGFEDDEYGDYDEEDDF